MGLPKLRVRGNREVALLEVLNFDIMAAGRNRLPSDPDTPTGVQDLGADKYPRLDLAKSCGIKGSAAAFKDDFPAAAGVASSS